MEFENNPEIVDDHNIKILWDKETVEKAIIDISDSITKKFKDFQSINIVPIMTGSILFVTKLLTELEKYRPGAYKIFPLTAKTYGNSMESQGTTIYGYGLISDSLDNGSPTIIVDDLMDTGETLKKVIENIYQTVSKDVYSVVLLDKLGRRNNIIQPDFSCFELYDDKWVVGYGMDYQGKFRGLEYIGYLEFI
jgi:hypoxanthine phosphoribosyltransferase